MKRATPENVAQLPATRPLLFRAEASDGQRQFTIPLSWRESNLGSLELNERGHFVKFKRLHRAGMSLAEIEAGRYTSSNGNGAHKEMQGVKHLPRSLPATVRWRERVKKGWLKVVAKTQGYRISQPLALAVLGPLLAFGGVWYWRSSETIQNQHDEIIRLQTKLELEQQKNLDQDSKIDQARNYATKASNDAARLEGKFDQFALTYSIKNASKISGGSVQ